jgi:uncharacterized protein YwqG
MSKLKDQAEQYYLNAAAHRKNGKAKSALAEIKKALDIENKAEYFFERAWAQIQLADFEEAETSLKMVAHMSSHSPSPNIVASEVEELHNKLERAKESLKKKKSAVTKAAKANDAPGILSAVTDKPSDELKSEITLSKRLKYSDPQPGIQSKLGGLPDLPSNYEWPKNAKGNPISFLCQLNLSVVTLDKSDEDQLLHFFFDGRDMLMENQGDSSQWKVSCCKIADASPSAAPKELSKDEIFLERFLQASEEQTFPSLDRILQLAPINYIERELYEKTVDKWYGKDPIHRTGGHPQNVQCDMQEECSAARSDTTRADDKWHLLLQVDSDSKLKMEWLDGGRLYFWICERDLREKKFANVWCILQSH